MIIAVEYLITSKNQNLGQIVENYLRPFKNFVVYKGEDNNLLEGDSNERFKE